MFAMINIALNVIVLLLLFGVISKLDGLAKTIARRPVVRVVQAEPSADAEPEDGDRH